MVGFVTGVPMTNGNKPGGIDPRLTALVVICVTVAFCVVVVAATVTKSSVDGAWFALMGTVVGGVLGYGVLNRGGRS